MLGRESWFNWTVSFDACWMWLPPGDHRSPTCVSYYINTEEVGGGRITLNFSFFLLLQFCFFQHSFFFFQCFYTHATSPNNKQYIKVHSSMLFNLNIKYISIIVFHKFLNILWQSNLTLFANQDVQVLFWMLKSSNKCYLNNAEKCFWLYCKNWRRVKKKKGQYSDFGYGMHWCPCNSTKVALIHIHNVL